MTVKLQELAIKSELKVATRYKNFKTVAMRCKNKCYIKLNKIKKKHYNIKLVLQKIALLYHKVLE